MNNLSKDIPQFRSLSEGEVKILNFLFKRDFKGKKELILQMHDCSVQTIDENGSLAFKVSADVIAPVKRRIPSEARMKDDDGIWVNILLHVVDGRLKELEIYKDDGTPILAKVSSDKLETFDLYHTYPYCTLRQDKNDPNWIPDSSLQ